MIAVEMCAQPLPPHAQLNQSSFSHVGKFYRRCVRTLMQAFRLLRMTFNVSLIRDASVFWNLLRTLRVHHRPAPKTEPQREAYRYVGTNSLEGLGQLKLLVYEGCRPHHKVLEVGCGVLMAGYPILQFLHSQCYVGIDPNRWLIDSALEVPQIKAAVEQKQARFICTDQFDASSTNEQFDFIISHSILSHCAAWQLPYFLQQLRGSLKQGGKILASIRFAEGNRFGSRGYHGTEEDFQEWQYPGVSFFRQATVEAVARLHGFTYRVADEYLTLMVRANPNAIQDWVIFTKEG
jgi:SAM-dependent methyltransferase